jgi:nucleotide-binding universal stress UspA family protein
MFQKILIATDGSAKSNVAANKGIELAKSLGAQVIALYVVNEVVIASAVRQLGSDRKEVEGKLQEAGQKAVESIKKRGDQLSVNVEPIVRIGAPAEIIVSTAGSENADLIVIGSHGESGVSKLLIGSVVQKVLYWASIPVLVVR